MRLMKLNIQRADRSGNTGFIVALVVAAAVAVLVSCTPVYAQPIGTVMSAPDGTLARPTNFFAANSNQIAAALALQNAAQRSVGTSAGTVAAGDDARFLTTVEREDLTDGGDSTIHYHASDRARANHTGTQPRSTISDFAHASTHLPGGADALPWTSIHGEDNLANRPTAGAPNAGYLFRATDNGIIYRSSGVDWIVWFDPGAGGGGGSFNTNDNYSVTGSWNFFGPTFFHGTNDFGELILVDRLEIGEPLELASGGTGATNAAQARVNIGANNASNLDSGTLPAARLPAEAVTETELDSVVATLQPAHANLDALSSAGSQGTGAFARMSEVGSAAINWDLFESAQTTGDTLTTLATKPLALDSTSFFKVDVVAAGPTNRAAYELRAVFANVDESGVTLGTNNLVVLESAEAMDAHIVREGTNAVLKVRGMPSENIWWLAHGMIFTHTNGLAGEVDGGGGGEDYAVQQGFEGTGYDNGETWVETGGPDPDYTGVVLAGSQSLRLNQTGAAMSTYTEHATTNEVHGYALLRPVTIDTTNVRVVIGFLQPNGTEVASVRVTTTGGVRVTSGASNGTTSATIANGNTYHVWWRYYTDGADVTVEVWFSTDGTKPSNGSANHATITLAGTTQIARLRLGNASTITQQYIYDNVRVKLGNNPIGSNPE